MEADKASACQAATLRIIMKFPSPFINHRETKTIASINHSAIKLHSAPLSAIIMTIPQTLWGLSLATHPGP
jgi:hypothetical protein